MSAAQGNTPKHFKALVSHSTAGGWSFSSEVSVQVSASAVAEVSKRVPQTLIDRTQQPATQKANLCSCNAYLCYFT
jgi:hypothetical protein